MQLQIIECWDLSTIPGTKQWQAYIQLSDGTTYMLSHGLKHLTGIQPMAKNKKALKMALSGKMVTPVWTLVLENTGQDTTLYVVRRMEAFQNCVELYFETEKLAKDHAKKLLENLQAI